MTIALVFIVPSSINAPSSIADLEKIVVAEQKQREASERLAEAFGIGKK